MAEQRAEREVMKVEERRQVGMGEKWSRINEEHIVGLEHVELCTNVIRATIRQ